jgi:hypothetical protein
LKFRFGGYRGVGFHRQKRAGVLQVLLLSSSLFLILGMCASVMWLAAVRVPETAPDEPDA